LCAATLLTAGATTPDGVRENEVATAMRLPEAVAPRERSPRPCLEPADFPPYPARTGATIPPGRAGQFEVGFGMISPPETPLATSTVPFTCASRPLPERSAIVQKSGNRKSYQTSRAALAIGATDTGTGTTGGGPAVRTNSSRTSRTLSMFSLSRARCREESHLAGDREGKTAYVTVG